MIFIMLSALSILVQLLLLSEGKHFQSLWNLTFAVTLVVDLCTTPDAYTLWNYNGTWHRE